MASGRGFYEVNTGTNPQTVSTAITLLEITAPSTGVLYVDRFWLAQTTVTAVGTRARIEILRKTGTITGTASPPTPVNTDGTNTSQVTVKWVATAEGTDGNILFPDVFDYVAGWLWTPTSKAERIFVPPSGIIALKFPATPTSASWTFGCGYEEFS